MRKIKESLEKYKIKDDNSGKKTIYQSSSKNNNKIEINKNKENKPQDSGKKSKILEKRDKKKPNEEKKIENKNKDKDMLNKKRNREENKKEIKKEIKKEKVNKKYISDEESESDSEDKSYSGESDDESSSESYSSSSKHSAKKIKSKPKSKPKIKKIKKSEKNEKSEKKEKKEEKSTPKKKSLKPKGNLVMDILKRWWYVLPEWPPENYDTSEKLKENKLRLVKIIDWKKEPKFDKDNLEKCYELPGYKYVYVNTEGKVFDFRPEEGKPSYKNLIQLPDVKLYEYLTKALKGQLEELEKRNNVLEKDLRKIIKEQYDKAEKNFERYKK